MINTTSARAAITMAMANGWRSPDLTVRVQTGSKGDTTPQILHGIDCGRVLAAVDALPEPVRSWIYVAYAPAGWVTENHVWRVQEELITEYHRRRQVREPGKIAVMALVCLSDMRARLSRNAPKLGPAAIAKKVRFDIRNWGNGWSDSYAVLEDIIDQWDREGLGPIAKNLPRWTREALEEEREERKQRRAVAQL